MDAVDVANAVELAPRVWWVGMLFPDDQFQCHVYLIEQGDQSVLIDPGSALVSAEVIRKVDSVIGVGNIRWVVCQHQDPDIIGALPALVERGLHPDAAIVTHWRDEALIHHIGRILPFWRIEEHNWQLRLQDRTLRFVFTPYAHFAGAFCTFDDESGTLFSSDIFGGFTEGNSLFATSMAYFDAIRAFHEHYMPSREILAHAIEQVRDLPIRRIAPQHGQVIPQELVLPIMDRLAQLECGFYLLGRDDPGLKFLLTANRAVHDVVDTLVHEPGFSAVATHVAELAREHLDVDRLEFWARSDGTALRFDKRDGFVGHSARPPRDVEDALSGEAASTGKRIVLPLRSPASQQIGGAVVLEFAEPHQFDQRTRDVVEQIAGLLEVGLEREIFSRLADLDRAAFYDQATHDFLTGLYNRQYLADAAHRLCAIDERAGGGHLAALMIDIDRFKRVNDEFGHSAGDAVLRAVSAAIRRSVRSGDIPVRYGGEEFLVLLSDADRTVACTIADRIRLAIAEPEHDRPAVTASVGVAVRQLGEDCDSLMRRSDEALYRAKINGRDRAEVAD